MGKYYKADSKGNLSKDKYRANLLRAWEQCGGWSRLVDNAKDDIKTFMLLAKELIDKNIPKEAITTHELGDKVIQYMSNCPQKLDIPENTKKHDKDEKDIITSDYKVND